MNISDQKGHRSMRPPEAPDHNIHGASRNVEIKGSKNKIMLASNDSLHSSHHLAEDSDFVESHRKASAASLCEPNLDTKQGYKTSTTDQKSSIITSKPASLRDIRFGIKALDALVDQDKPLELKHTQSKGTFRDWERLLAQNRNNFSQAAFSEGGLDHDSRCRRNHLVQQSRRSQMNELEYLNKRRRIREVEDKDVTDRCSVELRIDDEYSVPPSDTTKRPWLPATLLTPFSRGAIPVESEEIVSASCDSSPRHNHSRRKRSWYERPESLKGAEISDKPRPMQMVFFDGEQQSLSVEEAFSEQMHSEEENKTEDGQSTDHKSLLAGCWSDGDDDVQIIKVNRSDANDANLRSRSPDDKQFSPSVKWCQTKGTGDTSTVVPAGRKRSATSLEARDDREGVNSTSSVTRCDTQIDHTPFLHQVALRLFALVRVRRAE